MNVLDLFSGIGGFSLGFERAGLRTVAFCESDAACVAHLARHWPHVPVFGDVRSLTVEPGFCDVLCGGFPCQPFSTASRGRKIAVDLWPEFLRIVADGQPSWVVAENVPGIGHGGIERVCRDLEAEGYVVWPFDCDTALPQRQRGRYRILWLAHTHDALHDRLAFDAKMACLCEVSRHRWSHDPAPVGVDDVLSGRMDRFKQLGNGFTPYFAEAIGRVIVASSIGPKPPETRIPSKCMYPECERDAAFEDLLCESHRITEDRENGYSHSYFEKAMGCTPHCKTDQWGRTWHDGDCMNSTSK